MSELRLYRGKWCAYSREGGQSIRRSLGTSDRATALAVLEEAAIIEKRRLAGSATFRDLWDRYVVWLGARPAAKNMSNVAGSILPTFGDLRAIAITPDFVKAYATQRASLGRKPGSIRSELTKVASTLNWAVKHGLLDRAPSIPRPAPPPPRERYLDKAEIRRLLDGCVAPHVKLFVLLAATTGARAGALLDLTWDRVDFERGLIRLARATATDTVKGRAIAPMNATARQGLLLARQSATSEFVIEHGGRQVRSVKTAFNAAVRRAGLTDVSPHVLRHSVAVMLAENRIPMSEIAQMLGHNSTATTEKVYARFSPDYLRKSAAVLDF